MKTIAFIRNHQFPIYWKRLESLVMESSASVIDGEAQLTSSAAGHGKQGGWITFPFTIGNLSQILQHYVYTLLYILSSTEHIAIELFDRLI